MSAASCCAIGTEVISSSTIILSACGRNIQQSVDVFATFIVGDLNIHHKKWLRFSNANTEIGEELHDFCKEHAMIQMVDGPTRK